MSQKKEIIKIWERIKNRSQHRRQDYLARLKQNAAKPRSQHLSCANLAHGVAACSKGLKKGLLEGSIKNIAIVSSYNDLLSAHHPLQDYPKILTERLEKQGATAQFAAGVPAMCDGVTQGQPGMDLSLFSRDSIAQSTAIALSHELFDGVFCLGVCDKIVPGLLIGALHFGHLPTIFIPAGPMPSGLPNKEKAKVRQAYAAGTAARDELLAAEMKSYHSPGTCTFYGTANTNQLLMEVMGLHLPGSSFEAPYTDIRQALTEAAADRMLELIQGKLAPIGEIVCEASVVNALVALAASGGSTNHTIHLVAIAKAAGIIIDWQDFHEVSRITPLLTRIYPNGSADINTFHAAGGISYLVRELVSRGLLIDTPTITEAASDGSFLGAYFMRPQLTNGQLNWKPVNAETKDPQVLASVGTAFDAQGGIKLLKGNLGRAIVKSSAVDKQHWKIQAPALVFSSVDALKHALDQQVIQTDTVIVLKYQGPRACGMPEMHGFMPHLTNLLESGIKIALVTDGRMSGASGRVPVALHLVPEALCNGNIGRIRDGDEILVDFEKGCLDVLNIEEKTFMQRLIAHPDISQSHRGYGRELFKAFRANTSSAEEGACTWD